VDTVSLAISLPTNGTRNDYLHCVASALTAAQERGDTASAMALGGLLTLVDEGIAFVEGKPPHFFNPDWGRTA
jgi:hypothetical protein